MTSAYQQQLAQQLRAAEDELGQRRRQVAELADELTATRRRAIRNRTAWWSACRRATDYRTALARTVTAAERGCGELGALAHDLLARAEQAEARIAAVRELHQPVTGYTGWGPDNDATRGAYGPISQACSACGSEDDAVRWPCGTIRALGAPPEPQP